jgi:exodeoxyribonuclease VII small subunit
MTGSEERPQAAHQSTAPDSGELSFEAALARLERIAQALEAGELPLDEAIDRFHEGMRLVQLCREKLRVAEQKIELALVVQDKLETRPFTVEE